MVSTTLKKLTVLLVLLLQTTWVNAQEMAIFRPKYEGTERMEPRKMIAQVVSKEQEKTLLTGTGFGTVYAKNDSLLFFQKGQITNAKDVFGKRYKLYAQKGSNYQSGKLSFFISDNRLFMYIALKEKSGEKKTFYDMVFNEHQDIFSNFVYNGEPKDIKEIRKDEWKPEYQVLTYISGDIRGWYAGNLVFVEDAANTTSQIAETGHVQAFPETMEVAGIDQMIASQTGINWVPSITAAEEKAETIKEETEKTFFDVVEENPRFPGGEQACMEWLGENIWYPEVCLERKIQGRVYTQFVVHKDGTISDIRIVRSPDPYLSAEAKRVLSQMPRWEPGKQRGIPVDTKFSLPILFRFK